MISTQRASSLPRLEQFSNWTANNVGRRHKRNFEALWYLRIAFHMDPFSLIENLFIETVPDKTVSGCSKAGDAAIENGVLLFKQSLRDVFLTSSRSSEGLEPWVSCCQSGSSLRHSRLLSLILNNSRQLSAALGRSRPLSAALGTAS